MKNVLPFALLIASTTSFAATQIVCTGGIQDPTSNVAVLDQQLPTNGKVLESDQYYYVVSDDNLATHEGIHIELKHKVSHGNESVSDGGTKDGKTASLNLYLASKTQAFIECTRR